MAYVNPHMPSQFELRGPGYFLGAAMTAMLAGLISVLGVTMWLAATSG